MNNLLDQAAFEPIAKTAIAKLRTGLGLSDTSKFDDLLEDGWRKAPHAERLCMIGGWLRAACFFRADESEVLVEIPGFSTVGD